MFFMKISSDAHSLTVPLLDYDIAVFISEAVDKFGRQAPCGDGDVIPCCNRVCVVMASLLFRDGTYTL